MSHYLPRRLILGTLEVVLAIASSAAAQSPRDPPLLRLEADWFAPMVEALARRKVRPLRLWIGGRGWEIAPSRLFGARWRKPQPWWRQVTA